MAQLDVNASCQSAGGNVAQCISAEQAARARLTHNSTGAQIAATAQDTQ
jgi:hypothetical protein